MDAQRNTLTGQMPFPDSMAVAQVCCTAKPAQPVQLPQGAASEWAPFLATLPRATLTPILWPDEERQQLLRGSPVLQVRLLVWCTSMLPCFAWGCGHKTWGSRSSETLLNRTASLPSPPLPRRKRARGRMRCGRSGSRLQRPWQRQAAARRTRQQCSTSRRSWRWADRWIVVCCPPVDPVGQPLLPRPALSPPNHPA